MQLYNSGLARKESLLFLALSWDDFIILTRSLSPDRLILSSCWRPQSKCRIFNGKIFSVVIVQEPEEMGKENAAHAKLLFCWSTCHFLTFSLPSPTSSSQKFKKVHGIEAVPPPPPPFPLALLWLDFLKVLRLSFPSRSLAPFCRRKHKNSTARASRSWKKLNSTCRQVLHSVISC